MTSEQKETARRETQKDTARREKRPAAQRAATPMQAGQPERQALTRTVAFCCEGNTCRSKMAEAVWNAAYSAYARAESFGLAANEGAKTHPLALRALQSRAVRAAETPCTSWEKVEFSALSYVVCMTKTQKILLSAQLAVRGIAAPILFAPSDLGEPDIPDPLFGGEETYGRALVAIERLCAALKDRMAHTTQNG